MVPINLKYITKALIGTVLFFGTTVLKAESDSIQFYELKHLEQEVAPYLKKGFKGTIIVANNYGVIFHKSAGDAIQGQASYSTDTVVDLASVSKQFTAAAIMKLQQQGKVSPSASISEYIAGVPDDKRSITVHNLLTHTAGFKRHLGRDETPLNKDSFIASVMSLPLTYAVGEKYHYSNIGYGLLAYIVEAVSGDKFETYLFKNLLEPAGMFSTGFLRPDWSERTVPKVTRSYAGFSSPLEMLLSTKEDFWNLKGGGGMLSSASDMVKWHKALSDGKIISLDTQQLMYSPHVAENEEGYYYGYGWSIVPKEGEEPLVWHNGMSFFGKAEYWRLPRKGLMIFVASHEGDVEPWSIAHALYKQVK
ncbi:serine hydrolase domain-containing protein [Paraglaciecola sp.]|uniref:serine hydrolase domain-containing protein n=1 Tax=Paraglaciecola sp. TaxID=1920173 RepID=UPI0030F3E75C